MFAPVTDLGLVVIWDDGDDLHSEPRAPYPHAREVLLTRAQQGDASALIGGLRAAPSRPRSSSTTGGRSEIVGSRDAVRASAPLVTAVGDDMRDPEAAAARLPSVAWRAARDALAADTPVLVQVPRRGYLPSVACATCRTPARCPYVPGPAESRHAPAARRRAAGVRGSPAGWACAHCGGREPARVDRRLPAHRGGAGAGLHRRAGVDVRPRRRARDGRTDGRPWSSPRRAPSRSSTAAATARCCCSTRGRC